MTRTGVWLAVALGGGAGLVAASYAVPVADGELLRVLRFFAALKAAMAVGVLAAIDWRLRRGSALRFVVSYVGAGAMLAAAPGTLWGMHIAVGALLFHAGWILAAATAWAETRAPAPGHVLAPRLSRALPAE